jgi:hypothetical protein
VGILRKPSGVVFAAVHRAGCSPYPEFEGLPEKTRKSIETAVAALQKEFHRAMQVVPRCLTEAG